MGSTILRRKASHRIRALNQPGLCAAFAILQTASPINVICLRLAVASLTPLLGIYEEIFLDWAGILAVDLGTS
jgi:hypothetical protein